MVYAHARFLSVGQRDVEEETPRTAHYQKSRRNPMVWSSTQHKNSLQLLMLGIVAKGPPHSTAIEQSKHNVNKQYVQYPCFLEHHFHAGM